jgi:hypothetical protein
MTRAGTRLAVDCLGEARFVRQPHLGMPARPWDSGDWGRYTD